MAAAVKSTRGRGTKLRPPKRAVPHSRHSPLDRAKTSEVVWDQVAPVFEAMRRVQDASFVYVAGEGDDGPVKVGVAKDPVKRIRGMQTGNPRRLRLEYVLIGHAHEEALLHEIWEAFAVLADGDLHVPGTRPRTEWFRPEVRSHLMPIMATVAEQQVAWLSEQSGDVHPDELEHIIIRAHAHHGFTLKPRDEVRRLAVGAGYVVTRRSRLGAAL